MSLFSRGYAKWLRQRKKIVSPMKIIALVFGGMILLGTVLLMLPVSSRNGLSCGFVPALFTATSATCVTGLVLFDTFTQWSGFGQLVIITLIQVGGLGFMSAATLFIFFLRRRIGLKQRLVMAQTLSVSDMDGIVQLQKMVLIGSFSIEAIGAAVLTLRFLPEWGFTTALKWGLFHSISAFCNAGFDIFGCIDPGTSLVVFQSDPVVLLTLSALIILGGLGFLVWQEIWEKRRWKEFSVYTRLVLLTSLGLILTGWVLTCVLEWNNPGTLGPMSVHDKLLNGFFQSVTLRTAGFVSVDQALLTDGGKAVSLVLMLIGGSSGSTAGGLKTVTFLVLILFVAARARGKSGVTVFRRTVQSRQILDALTLFVMMLSLAFAGGVFVSATCQVSFLDALYETMSALATVGLTAGVTPLLTLPGKILIVIYMYFGRVGILTLSLGFLEGDRGQERLRWAETNLLIG